jgi:CheY-like chemotaxis protein
MEMQTLDDTMNGVHDVPDYSHFNFLIVEDTDSNKLLIDRFLSRTKANLIYAYTGLEAIDAVQNNPDINLVLMDIRLPEMNGLTATKIIKQMRPELPVLAQTAYAMESDWVACFEAGCNDFLPKPYLKADLISKINHLLGNT